jgi:hypothetical protein
MEYGHYCMSGNIRPVCEWVILFGRNSDMEQQNTRMLQSNEGKETVSKALYDVLGDGNVAAKRALKAAKQRDTVQREKLRASEMYTFECL